MRRLRGITLLLMWACANLAQAGIVFTPHLSEYSRLPAGQYTELTFVTTEIEHVYNRDGKKVHLGAPFIPPGDSVDATLLLVKYLWVGNIFRDTGVPFLNTHPQFCRAIGVVGHQQATGNAVVRDRLAGQASGTSGQGDVFGLCGLWTDEYRMGPVKLNGLWSGTVKFPVGRYDTDSLLNAGTHYWSYIPQFAFHGEFWGRIYVDGTFAYQINENNDTPSFGGLTPTRPADVRNAEINLAWKFTEHWFADLGYSWRESVGPNYFDKVTLNLKDQPLPPTTACATSAGTVIGPVPDNLCNSAENFYLKPRPGPYQDAGIQGTLVTAGVYYIYRTSTVLQARVAVPVKGRGSQLDVTYDVYTRDPRTNPTAAPISNLISRLHGVQEAAAVSASPFLELRMVYLFWAP